MQLNIDEAVENAESHYTADNILSDGTAVLID